MALDFYVYLVFYPVIIISQNTVNTKLHPYGGQSAPAARHFPLFLPWRACGAPFHVIFPLGRANGAPFSIISFEGTPAACQCTPWGPHIFTRKCQGPPPTKIFLGLLPWIYAKNVVARGPPLATSPGAVGRAKKFFN